MGTDDKEIGEKDEEVLSCDTSSEREARKWVCVGLLRPCIRMHRVGAERAVLFRKR